MGSGREEEDMYMNMVLAHFLQVRTASAATYWIVQSIIESIWQMLRM